MVFYSNVVKSFGNLLSRVQVCQPSPCLLPPKKCRMPSSNDLLRSVAMHNVLVTGGTGFIGSNFVRCLLRSDPQVHVTKLDTLTYSGSLENMQELPNPDHYTFAKGDICDADLVRRVLRPAMQPWNSGSHVPGCRYAACGSALYC